MAFSDRAISSHKLIIHAKKHLCDECSNLVLYLKVHLLRFYSKLVKVKKCVRKSLFELTNRIMRLLSSWLNKIHGCLSVFLVLLHQFFVTVKNYII